MFTVIETPEFIAWSSAVWSDKEREEFIDWISENPRAGDVIEESGGLRKVRWTRRGVGKSGGARVIFFNRSNRGEVLLLLVYSKSKFDNIDVGILKKIKEKFDNAQNKRP